jgi:hypothetical protein
LVTKKNKKKNKNMNNMKNNPPQPSNPQIKIKKHQTYSISSKPQSKKSTMQMIHSMMEINLKTKHHHNVLN